MRQIETTALWDSCLATLAERQVNCVLEVGAGRALAKMRNDAFPAIPARALEEFQHWEAAARRVELHAAD